MARLAPLVVLLMLASSAHADVLEAVDRKSVV